MACLSWWFHSIFFQIVLTCIQSELFKCKYFALEHCKAMVKQTSQLTAIQQIRLDKSQNILLTLSQGQADKWLKCNDFWGYFIVLNLIGFALLLSNKTSLLDVAAQSVKFQRKTQHSFMVFALPTVNLSSWVSSSDVFRADRLKQQWRGFMQPRTHYDHKEQIRSPWLLSVIRSVCDAGCYHLSKLLEGFHPQSVVANLVPWSAAQQST